MHSGPLGYRDGGHARAVDTANATGSIFERLQLGAMFNIIITQNKMS